MESMDLPAEIYVDYDDRQNVAISTVSRGPNKKERQRWHVFGAHELGPSGILGLSIGH